MGETPEIRVTSCNAGSTEPRGDYVLYWMIAHRRAHWNFGLQRAVDWARRFERPLVVVEGLRCGYRWASDRLHTFIFEGVEEKRKAFAKLGIRYVFYLRKDKTSPKQTVARLAKDAALIVTDDYPCFIIPEHNRKIAERARIPVIAVDSNGVIPMSLFEKEEYGAYTLRPNGDCPWTVTVTPIRGR